MTAQRTAAGNAGRQATRSSVDAIPLSGLIRIRDLMYAVEDPYRLDQGDVSFDAPATFKEGIARALAGNRTHYLPTLGEPRLRRLVADKLRKTNGILAEPDDVLITNGGVHACYMLCRSLLEPGDEVIVPDPEWPPCVGNIAAAEGVAVPCPLQPSLRWRWSIDDLRDRITARTRAIYVNSPNNPTGGVLTASDVEAVAELARERDLWILSDEAYEDVRYGTVRHVSPASLPGMHERTLSFYTFSKSFAVTGLRLGYACVRDDRLRERMHKLMFHTATSVASLVQYGGIAALEGSQAFLEEFRQELDARRDLFYDRIDRLGSEYLSGDRPDGAFYGFLKIGPRLADLAEAHARDTGRPAESISWRVATYLIERARIGCIPGVDFGENGEGYLRFCFARSRAELTGALDAMATLFA